MFRSYLARGGGGGGLATAGLAIDAYPVEWAQGAGAGMRAFFVIFKNPIDFRDIYIFRALMM